MDILLKLAFITTLVALVFIAFYFCTRDKKSESSKVTDSQSVAQELEVEVAVHVDDDASWTTFHKAQLYKKELDELGFIPVHVYATTLYIDLWVFLNTDYTQAAVITNATGQQSLEFSAIEQGSRTTIDVTDNESSSTITLESYKISICKPHLTPKDLYALFLKTIHNRPLEKMPPETIASLIESLFAEEMSYITDN